MSISAPSICTDNRGLACLQMDVPTGHRAHLEQQMPGAQCGRAKYCIQQMQAMPMLGDFWPNLISCNCVEKGCVSRGCW